MTQITSTALALSDDQLDDVAGGVGAGTWIGAGVGLVAGVALTIATAGASAPLLAGPAAALFAEAGVTMGGIIATGATATAGLTASGALVGTAAGAT